MQFGAWAKNSFNWKSQRNLPGTLSPKRKKKKRHFCIVVSKHWKSTMWQCVSNWDESWITKGGCFGVSSHERAVVQKKGVRLTSNCRVLPNVWLWRNTDLYISLSLFLFLSWIEYSEFIMGLLNVTSIIVTGHLRQVAPASSCSKICIQVRPSAVWRTISNPLCMSGTWFQPAATHLVSLRTSLPITSNPPSSLMSPC